MGKEAKIGLAVVLVLLVALGGILVWRSKFRSTAETAQANAEAKDKSKTENDSAAGRAETGSAEHKSRSPRESRDQPIVVSPAVASGHPPRRAGERDMWNDAANYRNRQEPSGEAQAISPPPSMTMPDQPIADDADPNDRYGLNRRRDAGTALEAKEPPAEAAAASAGRHRSDPFGNRSAEDYRSKANSPAEEIVPPDFDRSAPLPNAYRAEDRNDGLPRRGQATNVSTGSKRYGTGEIANRAAPNYPDNSYNEYAPYPRGRDASTAVTDHRRSGSENNHRWNEPSSSADTGQRGDGTYDVQPNDSFWTISKKIYGTGAYFEALEELNRGKAIDGQLKVGQNILAPDVVELEKKYPSKCPKPNHREVQQNHNSLVSARNLSGTRSYTVVEGDTLFDIARFELGKASRWAEIYELNRIALGKDFDYLVPGTQLELPQEPRERPDPITRRSPRDYQR